MKKPKKTARVNVALAAKTPSSAAFNIVGLFRVRSRNKNAIRTNTMYIASLCNISE
jgi:hypothetical protein